MSFFGAPKRVELAGSQRELAIRGGKFEFHAELGQYESNYIATTKYPNWFAFVPLNLFEQFQRVANFYFLVIAILSSIPEISPVTASSAWLPLIVVILISAIREAVDDISRGNSDREINARASLKMNDSGGWDPVPWKDLKVGDVVKILNNEFFPADIITLVSSDENGVAFVETANLDGETNLKAKSCLKSTREMKVDSGVFKGLNIKFTIPLPNNDIFKFDSFYVMDGGSQQPMGVDNLLMRATRLKNTPWAIGVIVYTGSETKVMMNATKATLKRSAVEVRLNKMIMVLFAFLASLCITCSIGMSVFLHNSSDKWYLMPSFPKEFIDAGRTAVLFTFNYGGSKGFSPGLSAFISFFAFLILFSATIPISLYVTTEVVKTFQAKRIESDKEIYFPDTDTATNCRTANLTEELGQVEYIFSDKTGTLTQNVMEFRKCTIAGISYGQGTTEVERAIAKRQGITLPPDPPVPKGLDDGFTFTDTRLLFDEWKKQPTADIIREFLIILGVCHTVQIEVENGKTKYAAASPDEGALVSGAANLGCRFTKRTNNFTYAVMDGKEGVYEVLAVNEFNSTRKRMSLVCKCPDGRYVLYVKGADTVIFERLLPTDSYKKATSEHLAVFADQGLRTLCLAFRVIQQSEWDSWCAKFNEASCALSDREQKLMDVAELIEKDLTLIGATAIEDKLQVGVGDCISNLAKANIKLWVLTGDKKETAINIGFATSVLTNEMDILAIDLETEAEVASSLRNLSERIKGNLKAKKPTALVVTGAALTHALKDSLKRPFLDLGCQCNAVICCRVSPLQKREVCLLVKDNMPHKPVTLSIGDGANDVPMILAAHIGVGIRGLEGQQAAMSADYAIAQFRYLERLILLHGTWSYRRVSHLICYFLYKNIVFSFPQFIWTLMNGFSSLKLYDDLSISLYNVFFTALPIMAYAGFERDLDSKQIMKFPKLYLNGQNSLLFNWEKFFLWFFGGIFHAVLVYFITLNGLGYSNNVNNADGYVADNWTFGVNTYQNVVILVTIVIMLFTRSWTPVHAMAVFLSLAAWFLFVSVYSVTQFNRFNMDYQSPVYNIFILAAGTFPTYWLSLGLCFGYCMLPFYICRWLEAHSLFGLKVCMIMAVTIVDLFVFS
jgi:phospholipid-transporting ATPase